MGPFNPVHWMVTGGALLVVGVVLPLLMVLQVLEPTFLLAFLSFAASTGGFLAGIAGLAAHGMGRRNPHDPF